MDWFAWLFPRRCVTCRRVGSYICIDCLNRFSWARGKCPGCDKSAMYGVTHVRCLKPQGLEGLMAVFAYKGVAGILIRKLKYSGVLDLRHELLDVVVGGASLEFLGDTDWLVVPVPLHRNKLRKRGFNQASVIGQTLAAYLWSDYAALLIRTRDTIPQAKLDATARQTNVVDAFSLISPQAVTIISGRKVLLVDDVWTTGSTMRECAKVLKKAGANSVWGFVVAS